MIFQEKKGGPLEKKHGLKWLKMHFKHHFFLNVENAREFYTFFLLTGSLIKDATNEFWLISQIFWLLSDHF